MMGNKKMINFVTVNNIYIYIYIKERINTYPGETGLKRDERA